jgi:hypothetical protein
MMPSGTAPSGNNVALLERAESMFRTHSGRRRGLVIASLAALLAPVVLATSASAEAETSVFFEETGEAFWAVPHTCADGSIVQATLLVRTTRDFETPETDDPDPTVRVQYNAPCRDGSQVSWGRRNVVSATIRSTENLKSITASGSGNVRDDFDSTLLHPVSFDVTWAGSGPLQTSVRTISNEGFRIITSTEKRREATATGQVTADGVVLVNGPNNHPVRATFIHTLEERETDPPS